MTLLAAVITNFGSYKHLEFSYESQGLVVIGGQTGSGKSTLCDIVPWILWGKTAKGGTVDEIRSWNSNEDTKGVLTLKANNQTIRVTRIRGKANNDLSYEIEPLLSILRGKDIPDTQKRLNQVLGMTLETFLLGSYFHEFSSVAGFFTTTSKIRRSICDQLADMSLSKKLSAKLTDKRKLLQTEVDALNSTLQEQNLELKLLNQELSSADSKHLAFIHKKQHDLKALNDKNETFEQTRRLKMGYVSAEIDSIEIQDLEPIETAIEVQKRHSICNECGGPIGHKELERLNKLYRGASNAKFKRDALLGKLQDIKSEQNTCTKEIEFLKKQKSQHKHSIDTYRRRIEGIRERIQSLTQEVHERISRLVDLDTLVDLTVSLRGVLLQNTVSFLQDNTNGLIEDHFDGEFKITLNIEQDDELEISITKDNNPCSYTQLSKGQRQIVKLCFSLSVMRCISNQHGVAFTTLFLDEALDGLDSSRKLNAFNMIQKLSINHASVFMVEHSTEVKAHASKLYEVSINEGKSTIAES